MSQAVSLFNELKSGGYDACLMTTFSIDFPFYEDVLLRRMQSSGINHHVLLADKGMALAATHERPPCKAGSHYVLAPMDCPGAFHPKLLLLLGKNKGLLAVGSHNATLSGFGQNLEITNVLRFSKGKDEQYLSLFQQAFQAFQEWLTSYGQGLPSSVQDSLNRTVHLSPWLNAKVLEQQNEHCQLLFSSKNTDSLWQQLKPQLPANINQIIGMSAFFDTQLAFMQELISISSEAPVIGVQPDTVSAPELLVNNPDICLVDVDPIDDIKQKRSYVHAKLFYLVGDESLFVSGSANFSRPAWLSEGAARNAEAVLVLKGDVAAEIAASLALPQLIDAPKVNEITAQQLSSLDADTVSIGLMLLDDVGGEMVVIPVQDDWPDGHYLAYIDTFGVSNNIDATRNGKHWVISRSNFHEGELLCIMSGSTLVERIVVMNIAQLHHNSSAGKERELQQALGSLNSDNPDIDLLFRCFGKMIPSEEESKKPTSKRSSDSSAEKNAEPGTLLSNLDLDNTRRATSGRIRCSGGDIGLLLDMFIYNLGSGSRNDSAKAFGEDALGRNEEDLIDSEDSEDMFEESNVPLSDSDDAAKEKADQFCQKKLQTILKRAEKLIKSPGSISEDELKQNVPIILGICVLTNELYLAQKKQKPSEREWVTPEYFSALSEFLFLNLFSEKNPIELGSNQQDESSIFASDEWGQLLGYAAWVAYHSDVVLKARLPLSASIEQKDLLRWRNACWLFLAQRIGGDHVASEISAKLLSQEGQHAESWLNVLTESGREVVISQQLPIRTGFQIASSPKTAFEGYKFVTEVDGDYLKLANINTKQNTNRFKSGFLDVFEVGAL